MTNTGKALVTLGVGGTAIAAFAFSGKKKKNTRAPYKRRIPTVPNEVPWSTVDEALCQCYLAGDDDSVALVNCTLRRVWPDVPWPHQPGDHRSVLRVWQAVGARVADFMKLDEAGRAAACAEIPEGPTDGPTEPTGPKTIEDYITNEPGGFIRITQTLNQNPDRAARNLFDLPAGSSNIPRVQIAQSNCGFNLLFYSRPRNNGAYGSASVVTADGDRRNFDVRPAWNPWNFRVITAATTGQKLKRGIGWNGSGPVTGSDRAYGTIFQPPMTRTTQGVLVQTNADPWAPENNPPAEALALLGWTLDELRAAWFAGNP